MRIQFGGVGNALHENIISVQAWLLLEQEYLGDWERCGDVKVSFVIISLIHAYVCILHLEICAGISSRV